MERRLLQIAIAVVGLIGVVLGLTGVLFAPCMPTCPGVR